jgi:predicted CxxxxCH...CXXCH cytochrome family protein
VFNDTLAQLKSGNGSLIPKPSYDPATLKCNNTFCHGDWKIRKATSSSQFIYTDSVMVGENYSPVWTGGSTAATCGSCHGIPPKGHLVLAVSSCGTCHVGVVDNNGQIVDKTRHMNGKINVFGQEYAF